MNINYEKVFNELFKERVARETIFNRKYELDDIYWRFFTTGDVARRLNIKTRKVKYHLEKLLKDNVVICEREVNYTKWSLTYVKGYKSSIYKDYLVEVNES